MKELARLLRLYADRSGLEKIALRAAMIFPSLSYVNENKQEVQNKRRTPQPEEET